MQVTYYTSVHDLCWAGRVDLDGQEWPPVDASDLWLSRPIYQWVQENCFPVAFTYYGMILFGNQDHLVQFILTWS